MSRTSLGLSKVMTVTCTYDHRVIQGAESGVFLARVAGAARRRRRFLRQRVPRPGHSACGRCAGKPDQASAPLVNADPVKQAAVARLIQAWRERGHLIADLDPLGSHASGASGSGSVGARADHLGSGPHVPRRLFRRDHAARSDDRLRLTYAGKMGVQYMHIDDPEERRWLQQRMEPTANQWRSMPATRSASSKRSC